MRRILAWASSVTIGLALPLATLSAQQAGGALFESEPHTLEAAYVFAQLGFNDIALATVNGNRARLLVALRSVKPRRDEHPRAAEMRAALLAVPRTQGSEKDATIEKLAELTALVLADADPSGTKPVSALAQARALAGKAGAVVVPVVTKDGSKILIVTDGLRPRGSDPISVLELPELTTHRLDALLRGGAGEDGRTGGWLGAYNINYLPDAERDRRWPGWIAAAGKLGPQLWDLFGARLDTALKQRGVKSGARLVWLPTAGLGILPLGQAQDHLKTKRYLADTYEIVYAPSLDALTSAQRQIANAVPTSLAAVVNPTGDLDGTEKEGRLVASHFEANARTVLEREKATPDAVLAALKGKTYWHFASHGKFSWRDARQSHLLMHGHDELSVARLLETDGLGRPRLVVLSACETGLYDMSRNPSQFIGLPGTFVALGAAGVVGTLWPVSDAATSLLIAKFYELHLGAARLPPPTALRQAQLWLRQSTNASLAAYATVAASRAGSRLATSPRSSRS